VALFESVSGPFFCGGFEPSGLGELEQTATAKERMRGTGMLGHGRVLTSIIDQFWQYAKEAILSASYAKTDEDRQDLLELARAWTQAALLEQTSSSNHDSPAEASAG
jgi:hypothetical protein